MSNTTTVYTVVDGKVKAVAKKVNSQPIDKSFRNMLSKARTRGYMTNEELHQCAKWKLNS